MKVAYNEQGECIQWQAHGVEAKTVQPALWVLDSIHHIAPRELLVVRGIAVGGQSGPDETALLFGNELGRVGVVLNEPVCAEGNDHGRDTFLINCQTLFFEIR